MEYSNIRTKSYWCGHCKKELSKTVYFQHKMQNYNPAFNTLALEDSDPSDQVDSVEDFRMSDHDDDCQWSVSDDDCQLDACSDELGNRIHISQTLIC